MADKKSILEEALLDINNIENALNANTKEILRSVAKEEINGIVKESLKEEIYDEEDIETPEGDGIETMGGDDIDGQDLEGPETDDLDGGLEPLDMDDEMELEDFSDEAAMMEAIQLKKVSVTHGDNGVQTKSPNTNNSGQAGMDSKPVKFSGDAEAVPTAPKAPSNFYSKGETSVKGAGNFKNAPGKDNFKDNGEAAPKPKHGDDGAHTRSPVAESRRSARRPIR
jgi:hypothetical protein